MTSHSMFVSFVVCDCPSCSIDTMSFCLYVFEYRRLWLLFLVLLLSMSSLTGFKLVGNSASNEKVLERHLVSPFQYDNSHRLVYSTRTDIYQMSLATIGKNTFEHNPFTPVTSEDGYLIEACDVSFQDKLSLFGVKSIYAKPIGHESNYLNVKERTDLKINFKEFAVDWLDHNVYVFYKHKLTIHKLNEPGYSRVIYNTTSNSVRNIVIEYKKHFVAWISNDHNIVRSAKDGSGMVTVHTEDTKIHCMTVDSNSSRFFYYVSFTEDSIVTNDRHRFKRKVSPAEMLKFKKALLGTAKPKKSSRLHPDPRTGYYLVLKSIDYDAQFEPVPEGQIGVKNGHSVPVQVAKYKENVFVILQETTNSLGTVHKLISALRSQEYEQIVANSNWMITSVKVAWHIDPEDDICAKNICPHLCVHVSDREAKCMCTSEQQCQSYQVTAPPPASSNSVTVAAQVSGQGKWLYWGLAALLVLIFIGLVYYYLLKRKARKEHDKANDQTENQQQEEGQDKVPSEDKSDKESNNQTDESDASATKQETNTSEATLKPISPDRGQNESPMEEISPKNSNSRNSKKVEHHLPVPSKIRSKRLKHRTSKSATPTDSTTDSKKPTSRRIKQHKSKTTTSTDTSRTDRTTEDKAVSSKSKHKSKGHNKHAKKSSTKDNKEKSKKKEKSMASTLFDGTSKSKSDKDKKDGNGKGGGSWTDSFGCC